MMGIQNVHIRSHTQTKFNAKSSTLHSYFTICFPILVALPQFLAHPWKIKPLHPHLDAPLHLGH